MFALAATATIILNIIWSTFVKIMQSCGVAVNTVFKVVCNHLICGFINIGTEVISLTNGYMHNK